MTKAQKEEKARNERKLQQMLDAGIKVGPAGEGEEREKDKKKPEKKRGGKLDKKVSLNNKQEIRTGSDTNVEFLFFRRPKRRRPSPKLLSAPSSRRRPRPRRLRRRPLGKLPRPRRRPKLPRKRPLPTRSTTTGRLLPNRKRMLRTAGMPTQVTRPRRFPRGRRRRRQATTLTRILMRTRAMIPRKMRR